jgi:SagB-type dehydrogenase family enzyme
MARLYRQLTSYGPAAAYLATPVDDPRVLQGFVPLDFARVPPPCKSYPPGLAAVDLPRAWPRVSSQATEALAGGFARAPATLDIAALARILHLSCGVVRFSIRGGHRWLFRAAGSAGGRFPIEVYISARGIDGLPDAVYWYDPVAHSLVEVGPPAEGDAPALVVTGVPWRTGWKYAERGLRHIYWDAGTMLAQTLVLADTAGLAPQLWTRFPDHRVTQLVGADGVHEFPVAVVGLGAGDPAIKPRGAGIPGTIDTAPVEFPLVTRTQHAGDGDRLGAPWPAGGPLTAEAPRSDTLDDVILRRGSARLLDPAASVSREACMWSLAVSLRGIRLPHVVAVSAVEGMAPGLYRWPDLDRPQRAGPLRDELFRICMDQDLCHDAAFVVIAAVDADELDDRAYLEAQLGAGLVEGRLHLAAYALGIGASGMTFIDSEIQGLIGEEVAPLLLTCVGVPTYRSTRGGPPGEPTLVTLPQPR